MGLFSGISSVISSIGGAVSGIVTAAAPIAISAIQAKFGGLSAAGGAGAVGLAALQGGRPPLGVLGAQSPFANPIARAQFFPPFNPATIPARPLQGQNALIQQLLALLQGPVQQTTSFNQGAFGATVAPGFRPFSPSFRSGQFGSSGGFQPGISRGLAPQRFQPQFQQQFQPQFQPQFQQQFQAPRQFQRFGGFGGGGFGGFGRFGGFGF